MHGGFVVVLSNLVEKVMFLQHVLYRSPAAAMVAPCVLGQLTTGNALPTKHADLHAFWIIVQHC